MDTNTTRRGVLRLGATSAAYSATVGIGGAILASRADAANAPSPQLLSLIKRHQEADAALDHFYSTEFNPIVEAHWEAVRQHRAAISNVPHVEESGGQAIGGAPVTFSSSKGYSRSQAEAYIDCDQQEPNRSPDWNETIAAARRYIRAEDQRNATIRQLGPEPASDPSLDARECAAGEPVRSAREAIYAFECQNTADLLAKLTFIAANDGMDGDDLLPLVITDATRLVGKEA